MKAEAVLAATLADMKVGEAVSRGGLHLFPLTGRIDPEPRLALLDEALKMRVLRVEEVGEEGSVPTLRVVNSGADPVLILEGDELVGAKQNRVVNSSVLVAADSELTLPVSCVERGRWSYRSRGFSSSGASPHLALRRLKSRAVHDSLRRGTGHRSDQGAVWEEVDRVADYHAAPSPTAALQDTRSRLSERLRGLEELAGELPEGTRGVTVALGGRPVLVEVLAGPHTFSAALPKLVAGYALQALEGEAEGELPGVSEVEELLRSISEAPREEHPAVGSGADVRFESAGVAGYALVEDGTVLHAAAFAG